VIVESARLDAIEYATQYELLRSQVAGTSGNANRGDTAGQARGVGLALLLREGVPGWLKTVESVRGASLAPRAADSPVAARHEAQLVCLPSVQRHEITLLLASLVLSTHPAVRTSSREGYRSW